MDQVKIYQNFISMWWLLLFLLNVPAHSQHLGQGAPFFLRSANEATSSSASARSILNIPFKTLEGVWDEGGCSTCYCLSGATWACFCVS